MWFGARLVFQSVHTGTPEAALSTNEPREVLYEESIVLIQADDEASAGSLARSVGLQKQHSYENMYGETVTWQFVDVTDVKELFDSEIGHGSEVFYRFFSREDRLPTQEDESTD